MIELVGWAGAACILGAYLWVTYNKPNARYHLVNLIGCLLLIINVWYHKSWPSVGINVAWAGIAIMGLIKEGARGPTVAPG